MLKELLKNILLKIPAGSNIILPALRCLIYGQQKVYASSIIPIRKKELQANRCYKQKIFCVGNNKTGTTSLKHYFQELGYLVAPQIEAEEITFKYFLAPHTNLCKILGSGSPAIQ